MGILNWRRGQFVGGVVSAKSRALKVGSGVSYILRELMKVVVEEGIAYLGEPSTRNHIAKGLLKPEVTGNCPCNFKNF